MRRYFTQSQRAKRRNTAERETEGGREREMDNLRRPLLGEGPLATIAETDAERSETQ